MQEKLIYYYRDYCGFCARVDAIINKLGIDLQRRNIWEDDESYNELTVATGRGTVPVLRIMDADGNSKWMAESTDIAYYLVENFAP